MLSQPIDWRLWALVPVWAVCVLAMAGAWYIEIFMNVLPCEWCLYARIPYYAMIACGIVAVALLYMGNFNRRLVYKRAFIVFILSSLCLLALAIYQTGMENGLFASSCSAVSLDPTETDMVGDITVADMLKQKLASVCTVPYYLVGLTLSEWNIALSAFLLLYMSGASYYMCRRAAAMSRTQ